MMRLILELASQEYLCVCVCVHCFHMHIPQVNTNWEHFIGRENIPKKLPTPHFAQPY